MLRLRLGFAPVLLMAAGLLSACVGGNGSATGSTPPPPVLNTIAISVDSGPAAAPGAINHAYVTVKVCAPGSTTQCANIDHVLLDTASFGLRLVRSVLAGHAVTLSPEADSQGQAIEECATFGSGQTWGPVALADVTLAGETAARVPVQVLDDTNAGAPPPASCGAGGTLVNGVANWLANGVLGVGVFAQDCGPACAPGTTPPAMYYGCTSAGACSAENVALTAQVTNPVALFAVDNNGIIVNIASLQNANGDASVQGELIFGLGTQSDNPVPTTGLSMLGADANGDFATVYNGGTAMLPALLDTGTDSYLFDDPSIAACTSATWVGYYCPAVAPLDRTAVNISAASTKAVVNGTSNPVDFAIANPDTGGFILPPKAAAYAGLAGGGGATSFTWGMPFFYGRKVYIGFQAKASGPFTGPYYAY
ncbi:MAG: DUF3443 family protein [Steroidobacterales bacterium]